MMDKMNDVNYPERFKNYTDWAKFSIHEVASSDEVKGVDRITSMLAFLVMEFAAYLDVNYPPLVEVGACDCPAVNGFRLLHL